MPEGGPDLVLSAGPARLEIAVTEGGRVRSFRIGDDELLLTSSPDGPIHWGSYPMAPWAGRIRDGRFWFRGRDVQLPLGLPPHAIHGVVFNRPWDVVDDRTIAVDLGDPWPFRGAVVQRFELTDDFFRVRLELRAEDPMPAVIGWHPWFLRDLGGVTAELDFRPSWMLERDAAGIPTGDLIEPTPGPWDDTFTGVASPPALTWPGRLRLEIDSTCPWWVVFTERPHAICIEPQSGPPDAVNLDGQATILEAGEVLRHSMTWRWTQLDR